MGWVTGLHTHFIEGTGFELRLLEVDGSATVALNPVYLYLVVTNNSSGGEEQTLMVTLPQVSKVKKVRFFGSEPRIEIEVLLDRMDAYGMISTQSPATFLVTASITGGKLSGDIELEQRH